MAPSTHALPCSATRPRWSIDSGAHLSTTAGACRVGLGTHAGTRSLRRCRTTAEISTRFCPGTQSRRSWR